MATNQVKAVGKQHLSIYTRRMGEEKPNLYVHYLHKVPSTIKLENSVTSLNCAWSTKKGSPVKLITR